MKITNSFHPFDEIAAFERKAASAQRSNVVEAFKRLFGFKDPEDKKKTEFDPKEIAKDHYQR